MARVFSPGPGAKSGQGESVHGVPAGPYLRPVSRLVAAGEKRSWDPTGLSLPDYPSEGGSLRLDDTQHGQNGYLVS